MGRWRASVARLVMLWAAIGLVAGAIPNAGAFAQAQAAVEPTLTLTACPACDRAIAVTDTPTPLPACSACELVANWDIALTTAYAGGGATDVPKVVRAILFWMNGCAHCHYVLGSVLPPLQEEFGEQLEILQVEVVTLEDVDWLYEVAAAYGIPRERVEVPLLLIGDHVLIGSGQIPAELPGLIRMYLSAGGADYPEGLGGVLPTATPSSTALLASCLPAAPCLSGAENLPVVHLLVFWTSECRACQIVLDEVLPPLEEEHRESLAVAYVDIVSGEDVKRFYQFAASLGVPQEQAHLPMIVIGDHVLIGSEHISEELPGLVERHLAAGGVGITDLAAFAMEAQKTAESQTTGPGVQAAVDGSALAVFVLAVMAASLVYALASLRFPRLPIPQGRWVDRAVPCLALVGLGVATYLAYVETQLVAAACGPIGDCNAVQSSPFARLFGVLPVGVLGALAYLLLLATWLIERRTTGRVAAWAALAGFGVALVGTVFSIYLTFLEPFIIRAVCLWCLTSAVTMTLILLLRLEGPRAWCRQRTEDETRAARAEFPAVLSTGAGADRWDRPR